MIFCHDLCCLYEDTRNSFDNLNPYTEVRLVFCAVGNIAHILQYAQNTKILKSD